MHGPRVLAKPRASSLSPIRSIANSRSNDPPGPFPVGAVSSGSSSSARNDETCWWTRRGRSGSSVPPGRRCETPRSSDPSSSRCGKGSRSTPPLSHGPCPARRRRCRHRAAVAGPTDQHDRVVLESEHPGVQVTNLRSRGLREPSMRTLPRRNLVDRRTVWMTATCSGRTPHRWYTTRKASVLVMFGWRRSGLTAPSLRQRRQHGPNRSLRFTAASLPRRNRFPRRGVEARACRPSFAGDVWPKGSVRFTWMPSWHSVRHG